MIGSPKTRQAPRNRLASFKIRIGDKVRSRSGRVGRVWELRDNGRASVAWGDAPLQHVKLAHVLLSNLEKVKECVTQRPRK